MPRKTLLLVFIHGFKGSDNTFSAFPTDLRALLAHTLPSLDILSIQYPRYETRGDLRECVARFKEWLQNKVIDLEVANGTPSPTVEPSVRVVLCGHSMGGIVAAETLLSIVRDEPVGMGAKSARGSPRPEEQAGRRRHNATTGNATREGGERRRGRASLGVDNEDERAASEPPPPQPSTGQMTGLFFPYIQAVITFDTPFLGISPGVLAHGAEDHFNQASAAYKAYDTASTLFGWGSPKAGSPQPIANASSKGLPAPNSTSAGWGKWAMYGAAAAGIAGAAGAAYLSRNQISEGFAWASSHLEFVGCLARGAELQKRVENVVELTHSHGVGFANFYGALGEKVTAKTKYAGQLLGEDRTFCVVPSKSKLDQSPTGTKRSAAAPPPSSKAPPSKKQKSKDGMEEEMRQGEQVQEFAQDTSKSKGDWVKCVNQVASDELRAHTSMFAPQKNSDYHAMLPRARDRIVQSIEQAWLESDVRGEEAAADNGAANEEDGEDEKQEAMDAEGETIGA